MLTKMKKITLLFLIILVGCGTQTQKCDQVNPEQAKQLVKDFLIASNESDFEKMKKLTTKDYKVYLDGEVFNHDALVQLIIDFPEPAIYSFEDFDFDIESDCNSAFLNYYCYQIRTIDDTVKTKVYDLQSAHIMRIGDTLKLNFIHSTRGNMSPVHQTN